MKSCESIRGRIGAWLDGELSASDAEAARIHVDACAVCGEERRQLERLDTSLHEAFKAAGSKLAFDPFWRGVEQRITQETNGYKEFADWIRATVTAPRLAWAVSAVIVIVLAALSVDLFFPNMKTSTQRDNFAAVESIDTYGRNVALLREDETKTTVIWLYQNPETENESSTETPEATPAF